MWPPVALSSDQPARNGAPASSIAIHGADDAIPNVPRAQAHPMGSQALHQEQRQASRAGGQDAALVARDGLMRDPGRTIVSRR